MSQDSSLVARSLRIALALLGSTIAITAWAQPAPQTAPPAAATPPVPSSPLPSATAPLAPAPSGQPPAGPAIPSLNTNPNATIDQLVTPPANRLAVPSAATGLGGRPSLGVVSASLSSAPFVMGDFFGGGLAFFGGRQTVSFQQHAPGAILAGGPGDPNSIIAFEFGTDTTPNDVFTQAPGLDLANPGDGADTFVILEPIPPSDALTSPGPGFVFDGGTAVYTNSNNAGATTAVPGTYQNNELWFLNYSFSRTIGFDPQTDPQRANGRPIPGPGVATRRIKIAENFSPEVRDRAFLSYSFFNDAFGNLGDISRYVVGFEKILWSDLVSFEARLPLAGTFGSVQAIDGIPNRDFEIGNTTLILKAVLLRNDRFIWSGGTGISLPTADDSVAQLGGQNVIRINNESIHLLPFMGLLYRFHSKTSIQSYLQLDVATNGDPVFANLLGGTLPQIGTFNDSALLHADIAVNHTFYRNDRAKCLRAAIANAEIHYSGTLQSADVVTSNGLTYTNLQENFNIVNATVGTHLQFGDRLVVTPGVAVPLQRGLNRQFDYEAIVQANYLW